MEEQRIGRIYLNLFIKGVSGVWYSIFGKGLRRSPALPWLIIIFLVGVPSLGWYLHRRGQFSHLKREIKGQQLAPAPVPSPGGMEPIVLTRTPSPGATLPELTSVTLLPGLGMDVLQVTAALPSGGNIDLLNNPTVAEIADGSARPHAESGDTRGAIEAPWGGLLMGLISPLGGSMTVNWAGSTLEVPTEVNGRDVDETGLLSHMAMDSQRTNELADGGEAVGILRETNFTDHWPSRVDLQVVAQLGASDLMLELTATNSGSVPVPFGAGWHPRFNIANQGRDAIELELPAGEEVEVADPATGLPSGRIVAARPAIARMQGHAAPVAGGNVQASLVHLKAGLLDRVPAAEFRDETSGYGLRISSASLNTRALRVVAAGGQNFVSLGLQTNYDDPFGREWEHGEGSGMVTLQPGQSFTWKVRLEIFPIVQPAGAGHN